MGDFGLDKEDVGLIKTVFLKFDQIEKVLIYGSRAKGSQKPSSDIDFTLLGKNINLSVQLEIESELNELLLPYKFDVSLYDKISNPDFKDHIDRVGKEFYSKAP